METFEKHFAEPHKTRIQFYTLHDPSITSNSVGRDSPYLLLFVLCRISVFTRLPLAFIHFYANVAAAM